MAIIATCKIIETERKFVPWLVVVFCLRFNIRRSQTTLQNFQNNYRVKKLVCVCVCVCVCVKICAFELQLEYAGD